MNLSLIPLLSSAIYFEKVPRYSDAVYLMSQYFIQHYEYISSLPFKKFEECMIEWDVFRIPVNFKEAIQKVNVPLDPEELELEIASDKPVKRHYYSFDDAEHELPINTEKENIVQRRFDIVGYKMFNLLRKYNTIDSYDYFNEAEEKKKESTERRKKYAWEDKSERDLAFYDTENLKEVMKEKHGDQNQKK